MKITLGRRSIPKHWPPIVLRVESETEGPGETVSALELSLTADDARQLRDDLTQHLRDIGEDT